MRHRSYLASCCLLRVRKRDGNHVKAKREPARTSVATCGDALAARIGLGLQNREFLRYKRKRNKCRRYCALHFRCQKYGSSNSSHQTNLVQCVIVFSKSISSAKRFPWKIPVAALAQHRSASAFTCSPTATGIFESKS